MYVYIHIYRDGWKDLREERQQNGRAVIEEERKNIMMKKTGFDFFFSNLESNEIYFCVFKFIHLSPPLPWPPLFFFSLQHTIAIGICQTTFRAERFGFLMVPLFLLFFSLIYIDFCFKCTNF